MTGSGLRGRSKRYWYYHCHHKRGGKKCSHRFRADAAHEAIKDFLADLEIADEVKAFYEKVVEDVANREKETQRRIQQKTTRKINELEEKLLKIDERRYVEGDLPEDSYQHLKEKYSQELRKAKIRRHFSPSQSVFEPHQMCSERNL